MPRDWYLLVMEFLLYQVMLPALCLAVLFGAFARFLPVSPADIVFFWKIACQLSGLAGLALVGILCLTWFAPSNKRVIPW